MGEHLPAGFFRLWAAVVVVADVGPGILRFVVA